MEKTKRIEVRVSILDKELIRINAEKAGISISQYLVDCALSRVIQPPPSEKRIDAYSQLAKYSNNFTSISNLIKNSKHTDVIKEVTEVAKELRVHLEYIRNGK